ncbi:MAG: hypothetical protein ACYDGY_01845 [Acidimicrobiales bacterium]
MERKIGGADMRVLTAGRFKPGRSHKVACNEVGVLVSGCSHACGYAVGRSNRLTGRFPGEATLLCRLGAVALSLLVMALLSGCGQAAETSSLSRDIGHTNPKASSDAARAHGRRGSSGSPGTRNASVSPVIGDKNSAKSPAISPGDSTVPAGFSHLVALKGSEAASVLSAWHAGFEAFNTAYRTMDWNSPVLAATESPVLLAHVQRWMRHAYEGDYIGTGHNIVSWAIVTSIGSIQATVKACIVANEVPVSAATGKTMKGFNLGAIEIGYATSIMTQIDGVWKDSKDQDIVMKGKQCKK